MQDDDDALAGIDLAAWQPPPPPTGTADAVVARMREPASVAAVESHERPARRAWWIGGISVAAASIVALAAWGLTRLPPLGHGEVVATRAEHLDLDGSSADLDTGAQVRWDRDRHRITAHQARGTVRWTIDDDDTLVIDSGGPGSTATIEASGANLRVEVQMNLSDMRLLGASTVTAAAVAVVTVVVYAGHVRATSGGQTVNVTPGATIELRPQSPPQEPAERRLDQPQEPRDPIAVGAAPAEVQQLKDQLRAADEKIAALAVALVARSTDDADPSMEPGNVSPAALERLRSGGETNILPDDDTKIAIAKAGKTKVVGLFKLCVDTSGAIASIDRLKSTGFAAYDQLIEQKIHDWRYKPFLIDGKPAPVCTAVTFIYANDAAVDRHSTAKNNAPAACDAMNVDDVMTQAANQYSAGFAKAALFLVQKCLACRQDARMYRMAAMYACAAHDLATAKEMFPKVPTQFQPGIEQRCQAEGLTLRGP